MTDQFFLTSIIFDKLIASYIGVAMALTAVLLFSYFTKRLGKWIKLLLVTIFFLGCSLYLIHLSGIITNTTIKDNLTTGSLVVLVLAIPTIIRAYVNEKYNSY